MSGSRRRSTMNALLCSVFTASMAIAAAARAQSVEQKAEDSPSARNKLIGARHLARIDAPEADGKPSGASQPKGMLIYTSAVICLCS